MSARHISMSFSGLLKRNAVTIAPRRMANWVRYVVEADKCEADTDLS